MRWGAAGMPTSSSQWMERQMGLDRLGQLPADGVERVQRRQRVLEDGADAPAADAAHPVGRHGVEALILQGDAAAGDAAGGFQQPDDGRAGQRLAGAGFADHAEDFAGLDGEGDLVEGAQGAAAGGEFDGQVLDLQERHQADGRLGAKERPEKKAKLPLPLWDWVGGRGRRESAANVGASPGGAPSPWPPPTRGGGVIFAPAAPRS